MQKDFVAIAIINLEEIKGLGSAVMINYMHAVFVKIAI
jgi:hypothetical protein